MGEILIWGFWAEKARNCLKMKFFKFYQKSLHCIFQILVWSYERMDIGWNYCDKNLNLECLEENDLKMGSKWSSVSWRTEAYDSILCIEFQHHKGLKFFENFFLLLLAFHLETTLISGELWVQCHILLVQKRI